jgi:hypothetical protein
LFSNGILRVDIRKKARLRTRLDDVLRGEFLRTAPLASNFAQLILQSPVAGVYNLRVKEVLKKGKRFEPEEYEYWFEVKREQRR